MEFLKASPERIRAVKRANERLAALRAMNADFTAKLGIYGLEITHFRPCSRKGHQARSTEIIPIPA